MSRTSRYGFALGGTLVGFPLSARVCRPPCRHHWSQIIFVILKRSLQDDPESSVKVIFGRYRSSGSDSCHSERRNQLAAVTVDVTSITRKELPVTYELSLQPEEVKNSAVKLVNAGGESARFGAHTQQG